MKIYEKKVEGTRHLFASTTGIPADTDTQLTYVDENGASITPALNDKYGDKSGLGTQRIKRASDGKFVNVFAGAVQIIGDTVSPVGGGQKHTIRMYAEGDPSDIEFNAIIENDDETPFTLETLEAWLAAEGYKTADDNYYNNVETVAGSPEVIGIASKGDGAVVAELEGGSGTNTTFFSDTVTPAN